MPKKCLWIAVTSDIYEFPIYIEDTAVALAKKLGVTSSTIATSAFRNKNGRNTGRKIVKIDL